MFALEWCEFCWSVRKLLRARSASPTARSTSTRSRYQQDDLGGEIRAALARSAPASPTIPQIFVGGSHVGGCTETFDAFADGRLQRLLDRARRRLRPASEARHRRPPAEMAAPA